MATVKINQKNYVIPQLGFGDMVAMEDMGFSVIEIFQKQKLFSLATAFTGVIVKCSREESEELLQQHVLGGGNIGDISQAFMEAARNSAFFKKLLSKEEEDEVENMSAVEDPKKSQKTKA